MTVHEDDPMPVFPIKGTNKLALEAIDAYLYLCHSYDLHVQAGEVMKARNEMTAWQERHPDRVKLPLHRHVPARLKTRRNPEFARIMPIIVDWLKANGIESRLVPEAEVPRIIGGQIELDLYEDPKTLDPQTGHPVVRHHVFRLIQSPPPKLGEWLAGGVPPVLPVVQDA